ncbi:MAG: sigma-70 family RNA polymerase sigma factor [Chloracidobacterium sp.]|nr:sigma-70 family RNA polymerase sigma factor [Chloracidobacterium sp.]
MRSLRAVAKTIATPSVHEDLFLARYDWMYGWALRFTHHDHQLAEDLVQDAFIQFILARPDLQEIENLDAYLYGMLRYMHLSSLRRGARMQDRALSIVEYDSVITGLRAADPRDRIHLRDQLRRVCQYTCIRKETSRAGGVLILRFFHGYYPGEIAKVIGSSRPMVEKYLRIARSETRLYLEDPGALAFLQDVTPPPSASFAQPATAEELLGDLRRAIFQARDGECPSRRQIEERYAAINSESLSCAALAHLVSCPRCLDRVNRLLGLPLLSDRHPTDMLGPDTRSNKKDGKRDGKHGDAGGAPRSAKDRFKNGQLRAREVFEHRPQSLCVAVNGYAQATQRVGSEFSELGVNVNLTEPVQFIEVISEQEVRLLFLPVGDPPPQGPYENTNRVELSDGRSLTATLRFTSPWPSVHIVYHDPQLRTEPDAESDEISGERPGFVIPAPDSIAPVIPSMVQKSGPATRSVGRRLAERFGQVWSFLAKPGFVTVALALALIAALLVRSPQPPATAAELLDRAGAVEETMAARVDTALRRSITLEERALDGGAVLSRRRIEIWKSVRQSGRIEARRVYDEKNRMVAGAWRKADGAIRVFRSGARLQPETEPGSARALAAGDAWRLEPSARDFRELADHAKALDQSHYEERPESYEIEMGGDPKASGAGGFELRRASLVVSRADMRATRLTLLVRAEGATPPARELRFIETSFEQRSADTIAPAVFEPDAELLSPGRAAEAAEPAAKATSIVAETPTPARARATAELEVEALGLLHAAGADLGEQISVARTDEGELRIEGIVDTPERKSEILQALAPLRRNPAARIEVLTFPEALDRQKTRAEPGGTLSIQTAEPAGDRIPADAELRRRLERNGFSGDRLEEEIRGFSRRALGHSRQALQYAWAMKKLAERFSPDDLQTMEAASREQWKSMLRHHAAALEREVRALRAELAPVFRPSGPPEESTEWPDLSDDAGLARAVSRLFELTSGADRGVQASFTLAAVGSAADGINAKDFWRSLSGAEQLAAKIASGQ